MFFAIFIFFFVFPVISMTGFAASRKKRIHKSAAKKPALSTSGLRLRKYSRPPPAIPAMTYRRSSPCPAVMAKRKTPSTALIQNSRSKSAVSARLRTRARTMRIKSYKTPSAAPRAMDSKKSTVCPATDISMALTRTNATKSRRSAVFHPHTITNPRVPARSARRRRCSASRYEAPRPG